jgi:hypothetical protein
MARQRPDRAPRPNAFRPVLSIRAEVDEADVPRFTREALTEVHDYITEQQLKVEGPPFSICRPRPHHRVDVEAGWPARGASGRRRIHSGSVPASALRARAVSSRPVRT